MLRFFLPFSVTTTGLDLLVDNYFKSGARVYLWLGQEITPWKSIFDLVKDTGFELERVQESRSQRDDFLNGEEYKLSLHITLFLFVVARKLSLFYVKRLTTPFFDWLKVLCLFLKKRSHQSADRG